MDTSNLRLVSIGIVAKDKPLDSKYIEVFPAEVFPFMEGEVHSDLEELEFKGIDAEEVSYTVKLKRSMTVKAGWIGETNRLTSPNVRKGEQVRLWTVGDTEEYMWDSMGRDDRLRRGERVIWGYSASGKLSSEDIDLNDTNLYTFTVDTIDQHITMRTSIDNKEFTAYVVQMNTKDGNVTVRDILGNVIQLDSKARRILLQNQDFSTVLLDRKDILIKAIDNIQLETTTLFLKCKTLLCEASESITLKTPNIILDGEVLTTKNIKTPNGNILAKTMKAISAVFDSHGPH